MFWPTHAVARVVGTHWPGCSGSRYLVALPDTRSACVTIGYALDCRRQSGAEERGFAESDGALRDAIAPAPENVWNGHYACPVPLQSCALVSVDRATVSPSGEMPNPTP